MDLNTHTHTHVGTNDILTNANHKEITRNVIKIGLNCKNYGVNDVVISSILVKKNSKFKHINPTRKWVIPWFM